MSELTEAWEKKCQGWMDYSKQFESKLAKARDALKECVGWIAPVMDGFGVPKDAESREILKKAQSALAEIGEGK